MKNLMPLINGIKRIFILEECVQAGSLASKLALDASKDGIDAQIIPINLGKKIPHPATTEELMSMYGLDAMSIANTVISKLTV